MSAPPAPASRGPDATRPDVSVVVVSFNTRDLLHQCLTTLAHEAGGVSYETLVVDNASLDGSADMVTREFPSTTVLRSDTNLGFAAANNRAFARARGRHVVLLNSDAFLTPDALPRAVARMDADPRVGLAGGRLVGRDGSLQPSGRMFPTWVDDLVSLSGLAARYPESRLFGRLDRTWADPDLPAEVDWVPGAFAIVRRSVLDEVGPFDERFFLYYEEVDLCRRIKAAGYSVWYWPDVVVIHLGGESSRTVKQIAMSHSGSQLTLWRMRSALLYQRKHHGAWGALLARLCETFWHAARVVKGLRRGSTAQAKAEESRAIVSIMNQAWRDTRGGRVSPPTPW
jgi:hypothetical protein